MRHLVRFTESAQQGDWKIMPMTNFGEYANARNLDDFTEGEVTRVEKIFAGVTGLDRINMCLYTQNDGSAVDRMSKNGKLVGTRSRGKVMYKEGRVDKITISTRDTLSRTDRDTTVLPYRHRAGISSSWIRIMDDRVLPYLSVSILKTTDDYYLVIFFAKRVPGSGRRESSSDENFETAVCDGLTGLASLADVIKGWFDGLEFQEQ